MDIVDVVFLIYDLKLNDMYLLKVGIVDVVFVIDDLKLNGMYRLKDGIIDKMTMES